ncbi:MAG: hypothetical protein ACHQ52_11500, partial [Candidatus Eisenbacteria bacterium]
AGTWWVIGTQAIPGAGFDLSALVAWLAGVAGLGIIVGAAFALWIDHGVIGHLRGLTEGVRHGQVARLRGLPASSGWGELSDLTQWIQRLITHQRQMVRATEELGLVRTQLGQLREGLEHWTDRERWDDAWIESGPLAPIAGALNRGLRSIDEVRDQNLEVVRQIGAELTHALDDARESAEQAERGFVEATSLLTTVRELQRLESELGRTLDPVVIAGVPREADEMVAEFFGAAREAIDELVRASGESVEHLATSLTRVHEVAEQVRVLSNRATLIALDTAVATSSGAPRGPELAIEMKQLALEVQEATARTTRLSAEIERESAAAMTVMRDVRARVAERLDRVPAPTAPAPSTRRGNEDAGRLLERMREMIQDATQKSERLSAAGERVSRAADRLVRDLEDEGGELAGLEARLTPPGAAPDADAPATPIDPGNPDAPARATGLRLLGQEHIVPDEGVDPPGVSEERP